MRRRLPRPFALPWGSGQIVEEVSIPAWANGHSWEPTLQLLQYADGGEAIRFCYYDHQGRFQRSPMMIDSAETLDGLREALRRTPKLRALLRRLVS